MVESEDDADRTDVSTAVDAPDTPALANQHACLVVIRGGRLGTQVQLRAAPVTIGRSTEADFQISAAHVSRCHCRVQGHTDGYWLEDLDSTNGTYVNNQAMTATRLRDGDHIAIGQTVLKFIDADNIEATYHYELHESSMRDMLTGIHNRRYFNDVLAKEIATFERSAHYPVTLLLFDIDYFKRINDYYGHFAGDGLLAQLTRLVAARLRSTDTFARIGGEEFAAILPECGYAAAFELAEVIRCSVERAEFELDAHAETVQITISIGLAEYGSHMHSAQELLELADSALYKAKQGGRNRTSG